jgi:catechol 2,3-dioxygenase-like lactoylglutathione lyase family enzyme
MLRCHLVTLEFAMQLGAFSVSLPVRDIAASRAFYEKLGFSVLAGEQENNWLIMKSGSTLIGLFQGMFERTMLTFNPGWDSAAQPLPEFDDVREIERQLKARGLALATEVKPNTTGPGHLVAIDPDGNPILIDQHR